MKISLRFKILGSFALIVILALGAAVGTGARLTRSRYNDFAYRQDLGKAESLSLLLGSWTEKASQSETLPPLPPSVAFFSMSRMKDRGMPMDHNELEEKEVGYLYVGRMIPEFHHPVDMPFLRKARLMTWLITAVIFVFSMILGLLLTRHITIPVKILNMATRKVEEGDLSIRVPDSRSDELGDLSRGFNSMASFLESADKRL